MSRRVTRSFALTVALSMIFASASEAGQLIQFLRDLDPNDTIVWGQLGPAIEDISAAKTPVQVTVGTRSQPYGAVQSDGPYATRVDQGNGWNGIYARGEALYMTQGSVIRIFPPHGVDANHALWGIGAFLQPNYVPDVNPFFDATITAYDADGRMIGTPETIWGNPTTANQFIGLGGLDTSHVGYVDFTVISRLGPPQVGSFVMGTLFLRYEGSAVPEPAGLILAASGLLPAAALAVRRRRRRGARG